MNLDDDVSLNLDDVAEAEGQQWVVRDRSPRRSRRSLLDRSADQSARLALGAFVALLVIAFFVCLLVYGRGMWFVGDEWGFLSGYSLHDVPGLFTPQNGHWSTVPVIVYRLLYAVFGLHSYLPYLAVTVGLHLTLATLVRVVMRRAGVGPWVATVVAATFLLYGTGWQNILLGVQVSMVGSMVFGVTHLILADHDGPFDRRDAFGLVAGALGLMSSGVGVALVAMVGLGVLLRRGWRLALVHVIPLAGLYLVWYEWKGSAQESTAGVHTPLADIAAWLRYSEQGLFEGIGRYPVVAIALGLLLVGGLVLAWSPLSRSEFRARASAPLAMLLGSLVLIVLLASQRDVVRLAFGRSLMDTAQESHYLSMITALTLPALGVAVAAVIARWRYTAPALVILLLIGVPSNLSTMETGAALWRAMGRSEEQIMIGAAYSPMASQVSGAVRPDANPLTGQHVTMAFLRDARREGKLPGPVQLSRAAQEQITTRLVVGQSADPTHLGESQDCELHTSPLIVRPRRGQVFLLSGAVAIARSLGAAGYTKPLVYRGLAVYPIITAEVGGLTLRVGPAQPDGLFQWCSS